MQHKGKAKSVRTKNKQCSWLAWSIYSTTLTMDEKWSGRQFYQEMKWGLKLPNSMYLKLIKCLANEISTSYYRCIQSTHLLWGSYLPIWHCKGHWNPLQLKYSKDLNPTTFSFETSIFYENINFEKALITAKKSGKYCIFSNMLHLQENL